LISFGTPIFKAISVLDPRWAYQARCRAGLLPVLQPQNATFGKPFER